MARMPPRKLLSLLAAALACAVAAPPAAFAARADDDMPKLTKYTFKVTLEGTQKATWEVDHEDQGRCDSAQFGEGSSVVRFRSKPMKVYAYDGLDSPTFFTGRAEPFDISLRGTETRNGSLTTISIDDEGCAGGDGSGPPAPDCGTKAFRGVKVTPEYRYGTDFLQLDWVSDAGSPEYRNCPFSAVAQWPMLLDRTTSGREIGVRLPFKELFKYGKNIAIGKGRNVSVNPENTWNQSVRWELTFKRIAKEKLY